MTLPQPLFTRSSYALLSGFILTLFLLGYFWWPLAEEYLALIDWQGPGGGSWIGCSLPFSWS
jgi:hypothetical protein